MKKFFLVLSLAVLSMAGTKAQSLTVFIHDSDGPFSNVRNAPNGKIVDRIPTDKNAMLDVYAPVNGWWQIADQSYFVPDGGMPHLAAAKNHYIHNSCIAVSTRNYGGQRLYLRKTPSAKGKAVYSFSQETLLRPIDITNGWVKVKTLDGKHTGWIQDEWICGNSVTNCN